MLNLQVASSLLTIALVLTSSNGFAKWVADKEKAFNGRWDVTNTESGQKVQFESKKEARKGARALNKADDNVMPLPGGEGDYVGRGSLP